MIDKSCLKLIINEVRNFKELQKRWGYGDLNDLIAHYVEESIICSKKDLEKVIKILETKLGIKTQSKTFNSWW
ncbi:MAG: hypothetical protein COY72_01820 [Candidatus Nealsonbacteria bacterium CG_4_10_14_0_8_um_filter_35_10]|uniref:Uncharacterized protein n=2 Tax=Candidatus Nealsoniibacteriota TaxID=1817911 RepID=A0A2M7R7H4_9BACT|nr:MAG: hypothetical protein COY72_01820 [Candidatus Nealsonbacteria bacterium CG_4_10_14_0_8_um_filter_35_10]PJB99376.1 MAG: hypothetical protein CO077_02025 [Candidatus Nealsonbacteria bacterium CG_4_9_14_0_8_um_filter_35_12]